MTAYLIVKLIFMTGSQYQRPSSQPISTFVMLMLKLTSVNCQDKNFLQSFIVIRYFHQISAIQGLFKRCVGDFGDLGVSLLGITGTACLQVLVWCGAAGAKNNPCPWYTYDVLWATKIRSIVNISFMCTCDLQWFMIPF